MDISKHDITYSKKEPKAIIINNFFGTETNRKIYQECIDNKSKFKEAIVGYGKGRVDTSVRNNTVWDIMSDDPNLKTSYLGKLFMNMITDRYIHEITKSSFYPVDQLEDTNFSELQFVNYGDGQKYDWHTDKFGNSKTRLVTFVYYFFKEPQTFEGGGIELSDGLTYDGKMLKQTPPPTNKTIQIKNDMMIIFSSYTSHRGQVVKTKSSRFEDGKFAATFWVGFA